MMAMKNELNWEKFYSQITERKKVEKDPVDIHSLLAENDCPPILEKINFSTTPDLENVHFRELILTNCNFDKNTLSKTYFSRVIFNNCIFKKINLDEAIFGNCLFERCEFTELRISNSGIHSTLFIDSKLTQSHFQGSAFSDVVFIRPDLRESDLIRCSLQNVFFSSPNLTHSCWLHNELKEANIIHGNFEGACFWKNIIRNMIWVDSNLAECLVLENSNEPFTINCTVRTVTRPIIGMSWNFNTRTDYAPIIACALRDTGAILLKIEVDPEDISNDLLRKEILAMIPDLKEKFPLEISSIPVEILRRAQDDSQIGKIKLQTSSALQYCNGLALPGGNDLQPEFYGAERDPHTDQITDYRRSIVEFALLFRSEQLQLPTMGTCRGAQLINVYFGGTLKQHVEGQIIFDKPQLVHLSDSSRKEEFFTYFGSDILPAVSMHHQAIDKVGENLEVIYEYDNIPKFLISSDNQYIASQIHPEMFAWIDLLPENLKPAQWGQLIYKLFLSKVLEFRTHCEIHVF
jgi:gamma-glutamyl-gamma-aminobutyrate hydrolase PuuD/uncharacterized protein YjbI with pentapeptide repeats